MIFVAITRNGLFGITVNIITVKLIGFFINKQKGKKECKYCTGKQADFSINMLQTKSDFSHHRVDHIFHSFCLKEGIPPANDSCNLPCACHNERLSYISSSFAAF